MRDVPRAVRGARPSLHRRRAGGSREAAGRQAGSGGRGRGNVDQDFSAQTTQFWIDEGVAAVLDLQPRRRRHGVRAGAAAVRATAKRPPAAGAGDARRRALRTHLAHAREDRSPSRCTMDIDNKFFDADLNAFNIVGEIPGTRQGRRGRDDRRALRFVAHRAPARPTTRPDRR